MIGFVMDASSIFDLIIADPHVFVGVAIVLVILAVAAIYLLLRPLFCIPAVNRALTILLYFVNAAAALTYIGLIVCGLLFREPGGTMLAIFSPWQLLPYAVASYAARNFRRRPMASAFLLMITIILTALALFIDICVLEAVHSERVAAARPGYMNCGPPAILIAAFWLLVVPLVQLVFVGIGVAIPTLAVFVSERFKRITSKDFSR